MRFSSMRSRMTVAFAVSIAFLMLLASGSLIAYARYSEERNADAVLRLAANKVTQELQEENTSQDRTAFLSQESEEIRHDGLEVRIVPDAGRAGEKPDSTADAATPLTGSFRETRVPVGRSAMVIRFPWEKIEKRLEVQAAALVGLSIFVVVIGGVGAWFLVGKTLSPIAALASEADRARIDRLQVHLHAPSSDTEIVVLVNTLNQLLARLSQAAAAQGRFYAAASHELRTPLHTLSGHLEVGLNKDRSREEYREKMLEAFRQTLRLQSLVQDLLFLTQLNTATALPPRQPVQLSDLCERTLQQLKALIEANHLYIEADYTTDPEIVAPPNHAAMIVRNLLENAVKYASPQGRVMILLNCVEETVRLDIFNPCPPLAISDVRQLVEPFYRPDESRQSETGGNGLGLAICDALAQANHWLLHLRQEADGFRVTVFFPAEKSSL